MTKCYYCKIELTKDNQVPIVKACKKCWEKVERREI